MGKEVFIDANVFLEIFLKDGKSEECKKFLKSFKEQNEIAITTDFIIYSCIINVQHNSKNIESIKNTVIFFNNYQNLRILRPSFDELYSAIEIMDGSKLDFDDSLVVACMNNYGIKELASMDKHFDKIKSIERIRI